jgi:hypothetical protein
MTIKPFVALAAVLVVGFGAGAGSAAAQTPGTPTFTKDVAPIFYEHCTVCHRPGEVAPMSLLTYDAARPYVRSIGNAVSRGVMPPWHADPAHGSFLNDRRLSDAEKDTITRWVNAGAPEGDRADLPPMPTYPDGWAIGEPDAILTMQEDYPVPADGQIEYKYFEVPTHFTEDKWITAYQVRPSNPSVVHHVIVYARPPQRPRPEGAQAQQGRGGAQGQQRRREGPITFAPGMDEPQTDTVLKARELKQGPFNDRPAPEGGTGAFVGGYVPGQSIREFRPGTALRLPAGATLVFQMHYTANGKATTDRTSIGFRFASAPPKEEIMTAALLNQNFTIPAGAPSTEVDAEMTLNTPMTFYSLLPHTHVRGTRWEIEAEYPDGRKEVLLSVPHYDFNWQTDYILKEPLKLPAGTKIRSRAWYDNSQGNRSNPDPSVDVHWGDQTWNEMQFMAFDFSIDQQQRAPSGGQGGQQ